MRSAITVAALGFAGSALAQTVGQQIPIIWFDLDTDALQAPAASIITGSPSTTVMKLGCPTSTTAGCSWGSGFTYTIINSKTYAASYSLSDGPGAFSCVNDKSLVCAVTTNAALLQSDTNAPSATGLASITTTLDADDASFALSAWTATVTATAGAAASSGAPGSSAASQSAAASAPKSSGTPASGSPTTAAAASKSGSGASGLPKPTGNAAADRYGVPSAAWAVLAGAAAVAAL